MEKLKFLFENLDTIGAALLALIAFLEIATRLTPTKTDDAFMERVGHKIKSVLNALKVPNVIKKNDNNDNKPN